MRAQQSNSQAKKHHVSDPLKHFKHFIHFTLLAHWSAVCFISRIVHMQSPASILSGTSLNSATIGHKGINICSFVELNSSIFYRFYHIYSCMRKSFVLGYRPSLFLDFFLTFVSLYSNACLLIDAW